MDELFIALCEEYHPKILKYLYHSVGNVEDAKDLTQEVFMIVYDRMKELENHENIGGFIYQTAKFTKMNFLRKRARKDKNEICLDKDIRTREFDLYEKIMDMKDREIDAGRYVGEVVSKLSSDKRKLYSLYYIEGKSYREIAKEVSSSEVALRMRYMRLRREIRSIVRQVASESFGMEMGV